MEKNKKSLENIIITELFLVKADWTRTFIGTIRQEVDGDGNPVVLGEVIVQEGKMWSISNTQNELVMNLDNICILKLDYGLHDEQAKFIMIAGIPFSLN